MNFVIFFSFTMISLATSAAYTGKNRIGEDKTPGARCVGGVDSATCESRRLYALNKGCVTREEYDTLRRVGSYPICSNFGENSDLGTTIVVPMRLLSSRHGHFSGSQWNKERGRKRIGDLTGSTKPPRRSFSPQRHHV